MNLAIHQTPDSKQPIAHLNTQTLHFVWNENNPNIYNYSQSEKEAFQRTAISDFMNSKQTVINR